MFDQWHGVEIDVEVSLCDHREEDIERRVSRLLLHRSQADPRVSFYQARDAGLHSLRDRWGDKVVLQEYQVADGTWRELRRGTHLIAEAQTASIVLAKR